jgi:hypothetical protein
MSKFNRGYNNENTNRRAKAKNFFNGFKEAALFMMTKPSYRVQLNTKFVSPAGEPSTPGHKKCRIKAVKMVAASPIQCPVLQT